MKRQAFARLFSCILCGILLNLQAAWALKLKPRPAQEFQTLENEDPFWKRKNNWQELTKNRKILVSVLRLNSAWRFKGAGQVNAPWRFSFEKAKEFNQLESLPKDFKEVRFQEESSTLFLKIQFLHKERELKLALYEELKEEEGRIYFRSLGPWLKNLEGVLTVKDLQRQASEVSMISIFPGEFDKIPDWMFAVAAEGVMHHVAEHLRKTLENDYKQSAK